MVNLILEVLSSAAYSLPRPFETKYAWARRLRNVDADRAYRALYNMEKQGWIKVKREGNNRFIALTEQGQLEALLRKASVQRAAKWDGKWRVVIFDIPEEANYKRSHFRRLLRQNHFMKLQASVYASPYPLNREAILYLRQKGLMDYIRILKVEEMDNDADLKKKFKLK